MVFVCAAAFCKSNQSTLINGEKVHFFSFPVDEKLREQWERVCYNNCKNTRNSGTKQNNIKVICHLHFEKDCFETINKLKPNAVPMVHWSKRKSETPLPFNDIPTKRAVVKLSPNSKEPKINSDDSNVQNDHSNTTKLQPYHLTIQIEKIFQRPCPKSKKNHQNKTTIKSNNILMNHLGNGQQTDGKNEIQYHHLCLVCKVPFDNTSDLHHHVKEHFTCDICGMEFLSQKSHKSHYDIHQSKNERYPYKCHVCSALFEKKDYIKTHNHIKNMLKFESTNENRIQYCKSCHMTFRDEPTFRKHLNSHVEAATLNHLNEPLGL